MTKDINIYQYKKDRYCVYSYQHESSRNKYMIFKNVGMIIDKHNVVVLDGKDKRFDKDKYPYYKIKVLRSDDKYQPKGMIIDIPKGWVDAICKSNEELMLELL